MSVFENQTEVFTSSAAPVFQLHYTSIMYSLVLERRSTDMARTVISMEKLCSLLSFLIFTGLFICAIFFSLGPIDQFLSQKSSFSQYTAPIEERPTIIMCLKDEIIEGDQNNDGKDKNKKDMTMCECEVIEKKDNQSNNNNKNKDKDKKNNDKDKKTFECDCSNKAKKTENDEEETQELGYW